MDSILLWLQIALLWLGCRHFGVMTGCEDHTIASAATRIAAVGAVLLVLWLCWRLIKRRQHARLHRQKDHD